MTKWEIMEYFRGHMLKAGWTPKQFERRIVNYTFQDIQLAINPKIALSSTAAQDRRGPTDHGIFAGADAVGVPIG